MEDVVDKEGVELEDKGTYEVLEAHVWSTCSSPPSANELQGGMREVVVVKTSPFSLDKDDTNIHGWWVTHLSKRDKMKMSDHHRSVTQDRRFNIFQHVSLYIYIQA